MRNLQVLQKQFIAVFDTLRWFSVFIYGWPLLFVRQFPKRKEYLDQLTLCRDFHLRWLRLPIALLSFVSGFEFMLFAASALRPIPASVLWTCAALSSIFSVLMTSYYLHVITRRLQCSLAEWLVIIVVLANVEGLIVSTPGARSIPWLLLSLPLLMAAGILHSAAGSLAEATILEIRRPWHRALLMLANLVALPAVGLFLSALLLLIGTLFRIPPLAHKSPVPFALLIALGSLLSLPGFVSGWKCRKKSLAILARPTGKDGGASNCIGTGAAGVPQPTGLSG